MVFLTLTWLNYVSKHLSIKEGSLFVLICQTMVTPIMLLAALESPQWIGVHQGGLVVHRPTQQDLLNIEQFFQTKLKKIKTKS